MSGNDAGMEILIALILWALTAAHVGNYLVTIPLAAAVVAIVRKHVNQRTNGPRPFHPTNA